MYDLLFSLLFGLQMIIKPLNFRLDVLDNDDMAVIFDNVDNRCFLRFRKMSHTNI